MEDKDLSDSASSLNNNNNKPVEMEESGKDGAPPNPATSGSKSLLFDKLDWWISDEDIFTGLQMIGISINDLVLSEFGFLEHKLNGKSKGSCFVLFKKAEACTQAFEYFKSNELCEGCIVKEGHPSVSSNPYRALGFGFQKQRTITSATSSTYPDSTYMNRPGGLHSRHDSKPTRRPSAPVRDRSRERRPQSIDRRSVQSSRKSRSRSRERDGRRKRARSRSPLPSSRHNNSKSNKTDYDNKERRRSRSRERGEERGRDRKNRSRERIRDSRDSQQNNSRRRSRSRDAPSGTGSGKSAGKVDLRERLGKRRDEKPASRSIVTSKSVDYETIPSPEERTPVDYD